MSQQRFYEGQTLTLKLETSDTDLLSASVLQIRNEDPNGLIVNSTATITETTKLTATLAAGVIIKGIWKVYAYAEFSSIIKKGRTFEFEVHEVYT